MRNFNCVTKAMIPNESADFYSICKDLEAVATEVAKVESLKLASLVLADIRERVWNEYCNYNEFQKPAPVAKKYRMVEVLI